MGRVEELLASLEKLANPAARVVAHELVQTLLAAHGYGLARMLELLPGGQIGDAVREAWGRDPHVAALLLLHGLHPVPVETRVRQALEQLGGVTVELVGIAGGVVRVRVVEAGDLAPADLERLLDEALAAAAPDVEVVEVEGVGDPVCRLPLPLITP
jgi:hypothetical protein